MTEKPSEFLKFSRPLWRHQREALDRFANKNAFALLHDMGVGKTTTAIALLRWKFSCAGEVTPTLVISPVATLWNWRDEFERNSPPKVFEKVQVLYGDGKKRAKLLDDKDKLIFITNFECFDMPTVVEKLAKRGFVNVIIDEGQRIKNHRSKRFREILRVSDKAEVRGLLTGTPILNSFMDLWSQWRFLDKGKTFGTSFFTFRNEYFVDKNAGMPPGVYFPNFVPKANIAAKFYAKLEETSSRVEKKDCLDLPPLIRQTTLVELGKEQAKAYKAMSDELIAEVSSGVISASIALVKVLRLLQIVSGVVGVHNDESFVPEHIFRDNPRLDQLAEDLEMLTPQHKVIVWTNFSGTYDPIIKIAEKFGKVAELTGRTKDRAEQIRLFNEDPECRVMVSNPQAGGVGVNLTAASYAIYFSRNYSLGDRLQSEARNYRGGSEIHDKITLIDYVTKDTIDEDVLAALSKKEDFSSNLLDRLKASPNF